MLVLTRRLGDKIVITTKGPARIDVYVSGVNEKKVKIGVKAPLDVLINRGEVQDAIDAGAPIKRQEPAA